jgi:hypothetical protein
MTPLVGPSTGHKGAEQTPLLLIVSRDQPRLFRYLQRVFAAVGEVCVIYDRRGRERRRPVFPSGIPEPHVLEPRRTERRIQASLESRLALLGWAVAPLR